MFNRLLIKTLRQQISHLRADLRDERARSHELLDKFVHNKVPPRLQATTAAPSQPSQFQSSMPSDAYSSAIADAERLVREKLAIKSGTTVEEQDDMVD